MDESQSALLDKIRAFLPILDDSEHVLTPEELDELMAAIRLFEPLVGVEILQSIRFQISEFRSVCLNSGSRVDKKRIRLYKDLKTSIKTVDALFQLRAKLFIE